MARTSRRSPVTNLAPTFLLGLALALLLPGRGTSQAAAPTATTPPDEETAVFGETVDVRVVNLEVVVVDKSGQRVRGLAPGDFRLLVDGKPVKIDYFTEVAEGRAAGKAGNAAPEAAPPVPGTATPGSPPTAASPALPDVQGVERGGDVGTSYVLFVDDFFYILPARRNLVLREIAKGLDKLGPEDRMTVVRFDGRRPRVLIPWSSSRERLQQTLDLAMTREGRGKQRDAVEFADQIAGLDRRGPADGGGLGSAAGTTYNQSLALSVCQTVRLYESDLSRVVAGVAATMRSLADAPGRKVMLLVTPGWPRSAKDYFIGGEDPLEGLPGCTLLGPKLFDPIQETANRVGFTVYPIVAQDPPSAVDSDSSNPRNPLTGGDPFQRFSVVQETAYHIARQTGGKPMVAGNRLDALAKVVEDTRSYYWLGFTPDWKGNDSNHKVKVELVRPGLEVRARAGFQDLSRRTEVDYAVESTLLLGEAARGAAPLPIQLGPLPEGKSKTVRVPLKIGIPMDAVTMIERRGKYYAELELRVAALGEQGERNEVKVIPVKLTGDRPPKHGEHSIYSTEVALTRQKQEIVIALYDPASGKLLEAKATMNP